MESDRKLAPLSKDQCLRLVDSVQFGRIVFTSRAMPAVRLVPHARIGTHIFIPASPDIGVTADEPGTVVAYEADVIAANREPAWTVQVVGRARRISARDLPAGQRERLGSWPGGVQDEVIEITTDLVTGEQVLRGKALRIPAQRVTA